MEVLGFRVDGAKLVLVESFITEVPELSGDDFPNCSGFYSIASG